jgi:AcrR family transcriptional regulator
MPQPKAKLRRTKAERWPPEQRRRQLIRIASRLIAERGMDGLRTRDIAAAAKINIATLHYYFPTKEALVQAVVADLIDQFRSARSSHQPTDTSATELLRLEMQDVRTRVLAAQEQLAVLTELAIRARRDPEMARIVRRLDVGWHRQLTGILQSGKDSGEFRREIDPASAATAIMTQLRGLGYLPQSRPAAVLSIFDQIEAQIEAWLRPG